MDIIAVVIGVATFLVLIAAVTLLDRV